MTNEKISLEMVERAFHEYYEAMHRYAYTLVRENETAKDIVQKVFMSLWERRDDIEIKSSLRSYLFRATHNHCMNYVTRTKTFVGLEQISTEKESFDSAGHVIEVEETQKQINAAIAKLPSQCQIIFLKNREEGKSYLQTALELGIAVKTVEAQMTKALKILRAELASLLFCTMIMASSFSIEIQL